MVKKIIRTSMVGDLNPRWNGGCSEYQLHGYLKRQRIEILKAAKGKCQICENAKVALVHHIDGQKDNHERGNLIAVCHDCHMAIHEGRKNKTSKFIRELGIGLIDIAEELGLSYNTAYHMIKNPDKRQALLERYHQRVRIAEERP